MAYQYGSCGKRKSNLGLAIIDISADVRLHRQADSNLYFVEVYDDGCGWYRYSTVAESEYEATSRAEYTAR